MIPKIIHYCWFGSNPIPKSLKKYLETWEKFCPSYKIKLWNENNFDVDQHLFSQTAYAHKKFAYVSDYVRAYALFHEGGIYLDTDVELKASLDQFLQHEAFTGFEAVSMPFTAVWAAISGHSLTKKVLMYYNDRTYTPCQEPNTQFISKILVDDFGINAGKNTLQVGDDGKNTIHIYPAEYFCLDILPNFATHHFEGSWLKSKSRSYKSYLHSRYHLEQIFKDDPSGHQMLSAMSQRLTFTSIFKLILYRLYHLCLPNIFKNMIQNYRR